MGCERVFLQKVLCLCIQMMCLRYVPVYCFFGPDFFKQDYVFFALSYEPERKTNLNGGIFHDQLQDIVIIN